MANFLTQNHLDSSQSLADNANSFFAPASADTSVVDDIFLQLTYHLVSEFKYDVKF